MGKKIKGKDFVIYMDDGGINVPVCCGKNLTITVNQEVIEATKAPDSRWGNSIAGGLSWSITTNSLATIGNTLTMKDIFGKATNGTVFEIVIGVASRRSSTGTGRVFLAAADDLFFSGKILLNSYSVSGSDNDVVNYSLSAVGDGALNITNPYRYSIASYNEDGSPNYGAVIAHGALNDLDIFSDC